MKQSNNLANLDTLTTILANFVEKFNRKTVEKSNYQVIGSHSPNFAQHSIKTIFSLIFNYAFF